MYKSRFKLWVFVGLIAAVIFLFGNTVKDGVTNLIQYLKQEEKIVTVMSSDILFSKALNGLEIDFKTNLAATSNQYQDADITINKGTIKTSGYLQETFYSPIVALVNYANADCMFANSSPSNKVKKINLGELINGYIEDKKFEEFYTSSCGGNMWKKTPVVYVDPEYETEIKAVLTMALAGTYEITQEDVDKHSEKVKAFWDKAVKPEDMDVFLSKELDTSSVVIAPEYKVLINPSFIRQLSLTNTVAVRYTIEYKEGLQNIVTSEKFSSKLGLRREGIDKVEKGEVLKYADWFIRYIYNDALNFDFPKVEKEKTEIADISDVLKTAAELFVPIGGVGNSLQEGVEPVQEEINEETSKEIGAEELTGRESEGLSAAEAFISVCFIVLILYGFVHHFLFR